MYKTSGNMGIIPNPIDKVKDDSHRDAKFLKVELAIAVDVSQIPHSLQLVVAQLAVLQDRCRLSAVEVGAAVGEGGEYLPIPLYFPLLNLLVRHDSESGIRLLPGKRRCRFHGSEYNEATRSTIENSEKLQ